MQSSERSLEPVSADRRERLFDEALQDCAVALDELEALKADWLAYQEQDLPAYVAWLHAHFGPMIQQIRETFDQMSAKRGVVETVEDIVHEFDCGFGEAYAIYQQRQKEAESQAEAEAREAEELERALAQEQEEEGYQPSFDWESAAGTKRKKSASGAESAGERKEWSHRSIPPPGGSDEAARPDPRSKLKPEVAAELKTVYRGLARKLHPDVSGLDGARHDRARQLWFQVQEAYEAADLPRLQTLAGIADTLGGVESPAGEGRALGLTARLTLRLSDVLATARRYRRAGVAIRRDLERARRSDPAFGFFRNKKGPVLKKQARRELESELAEVSEALQSLEGLLEGWEHEADRVRRQLSRAVEQGTGRGSAGGSRSRGGRGGGRGGRGRRRSP